VAIFFVHFHSLSKTRLHKEPRLCIKQRQFFYFYRISHCNRFGVVDGGGLNTVDVELPQITGGLSSSFSINCIWFKSF
jgi:hypothetical protein